MATLTNDDFKRMKRFVRRDPADKQTLTTSGLNKQQMQAAVQALEDWWNKAAVQASAKSDMDAAAGETLSGPVAKLLGKLWLKNKAR